MSETKGATAAWAAGGSPARIALPRSSPTPDTWLRSKLPVDMARWIPVTTWGGTPAAPSWGTSWSLNVVSNTVPAIARAMVPPIWRKNVRLDVATPSSWKGTAFWTMIVNTVRVGPTPTPAMNIQSQKTGSGVVAVSWVMRAVPTPMIRIDTTTSHLYRPVRATTWPEMIEL